MSKDVTDSSLILQSPGTSITLSDRVIELLSDAKLERFRLSVAYARWSGLGLIASNIEVLLKAGGEFQAIYGVGNDVTTPDSLLYSLYLQELYTTHTYSGAVQDKFSNSTFHPKFFEFRLPDKTICLVGSANLTGGGLNRNTELMCEVECLRGGQLEERLDAVWNLMQDGSKQISLKLIRDLVRKKQLGAEKYDKKNNSAKSGLPQLKKGGKVSPKPLFSKVLDLKKPNKKSKILSKLDPLTERPDKLYLQILDYETGGSNDKPGYQIQLPVAVLATFFGVGTDQTKEVSFRFGADQFSVKLTHFQNNTHRVRLKPIRDISRPAIIVFRRHDDDGYQCSIVPTKKYAEVLSNKCAHQTRRGARRWGFE